MRDRTLSEPYDFMRLCSTDLDQYEYLSNPSPGLSRASPLDFCYDMTFPHDAVPGASSKNFSSDDFRPVSDQSNHDQHLLAVNLQPGQHTRSHSDRGRASRPPRVRQASYNANDRASSSSSAEFEETVHTKTGRVSRALKGKKVHLCNTCSKVYSRAEHLRRHQLSHGSQTLECSTPSCRKTFFRSDLLQRHEDEHVQSGASGRVSSHQLTPVMSNLGLLSRSTTRSGSMLDEPLTDEAHVPQFAGIEASATDLSIASHPYAFPTWPSHSTSSNRYGDPALVADELAAMGSSTDAAQLGERSSFLPEMMQYSFDQPQQPRATTHARRWSQRRVVSSSKVIGYPAVTEAQYLANPVNQYQPELSNSLDQHYAGNYTYGTTLGARPSGHVDQGMGGGGAVLATIETPSTEARHTRRRRSKKQGSQ